MQWPFMVLNFFWKAIVYTEHKLDFKSGTPKGTGMSIDNVIYYVRTQMYKDYLKKKENKKDYAEAEGQEDADLIENSSVGSNSNRNDKNLEDWNNESNA